MYDSQKVAERIKGLTKFHNVSVKRLLEDVGLGFNTMSNMKTSMPRADNLAKIADYLDCSVDYLLGRVDTPNSTYSINGNNNVQAINGDHSQLTITSEKIDKTTNELIELVQDLPLVKKAEAIIYINKLLKDEGSV